MRRQVVFVIGLLVAIPAVALGGVTGSDHDLTAGVQVCFTCHIPHNAFGDKLWHIAILGNENGAAARLRRRLTMSRYCEPSVINRFLDITTALKKRTGKPPVSSNPLK